jgi:hypothetical protein
MSSGLLTSKIRTKAISDDGELSMIESGEELPSDDASVVMRDVADTGVLAIDGYWITDGRGFLA